MRGSLEGGRSPCWSHGSGRIASKRGRFQHATPCTRSQRPFRRGVMVEDPERVTVGTLDTQRRAASRRKSRGSLDCLALSCIRVGARGATFLISLCSILSSSVYLRTRSRRIWSTVRGLDMGILLGRLASICKTE